MSANAALNSFGDLILFLCSKLTMGTPMTRADCPAHIKVDLPIMLSQAQIVLVSKRTYRIPAIAAVLLSPCCSAPVGRYRNVPLDVSHFDWSTESPIEL